MDHPRAAQAESADERDAALAALLQELTDRRLRGEAPDLDEAARSRPDLADELRALWAAALLTEELVGAGPDAETALWPPPDEQVMPEGAEAAAPGECELLEELGRGG